MPLFNPQEEQFERRANVGRWQIVRVHFENPNEDTVIPHQLPTPVPEQISYQLLNCTGPAVLYHDGTPTRRPWGKGYIILRSNIAPVTCDVLLTISAAPIGTTTLPQGAFTLPGIDADTLDGLDSTAFARSNGTYVTTSAEAGLVNSFNLGGLSSGLLKHTVTGGNSTPATAIAGTDYVAPGDVTTSGLTMTAARLLGRSTASTGAIEEIQVGSGLNLSGGVLSASGGSGTATRSIVVQFSKPTAGQQAMLYIPVACTITAATLIADQAGDLVVDIWVDSLANFPPTDADSITSATPPTLSSAQTSQDTTLTGWTTHIAAGSTVIFNVDSAATVEAAALILTVTA